MKNQPYSLRREEGEQYKTQVRDLKQVFFAPTWKKEYLVKLRVYSFNKLRGESIRKFRMNAIASTKIEAVGRAKAIAKNLYSEFYRVEEVETTIVK